MHPTLWASRTSPVKAEAAGAGSNSSFLSLDANGQRGLPFVKVNALQQQQIQSLPLEPGPLGLVVDARNAQVERDYSTMVIPIQQTDPFSNQVQINSRQQCPAPYVRDAGLWQSDLLDRLLVKESGARASEVMKAEALSSSEDALRERSEPTFRCYTSESDVCDDSSLGELSPCSSRGGNFSKGEDGGISVESTQFSRPVEQQQQQMSVPQEDLQMGMGLGLGAGGRSLFPDQNYPIELEKSRSMTPRSQQDYDLSRTPASSAYLQLIETKKDVKERGTPNIKHDDRDDVSVEDNGRGQTVKESPGAGSYFPSSLGTNFMNAGGPGPAIPPAPPLLMRGNPGNVYLQNEIPNLPPLDQVIVSHPSGVQMDENLGSMGHGMMYRPTIVPAAIDIAAVVNSRPKRRNVRISSDPQSVAARHRREKISDRIRVLQMLVPGGTKMDTASMLEEAIQYVKYLKKSVQAVSKMANAGGGGGDYDGQHGFGSSMFLRNPVVPIRGSSGNDCSSMSQGVAAPPEQQVLYGAGAPPLSYPSFADQARQQYSVCH